MCIKMTIPGLASFLRLSAQTAFAVVALACLSLSAQAFTYGTTTDPTFGNAPYGNIGNFTELETVEITTSDVGQSFQRNWFVAEGTACEEDCSTLPFDIEASATLEVVSFDSDELVLDIWINNDTNPSVQAALMSFGFGVDPNADAVLVEDGEKFNDLKNKGKKGNFPGGFKSIDICIFAANKCSGGGINSGLQAGETDYLRVSITPDQGDFGAPPTVTLAAFPVKFQSYAGSFELPSSPPSDDPPPPTVSEPGALALAAVGMPLALYIRRRRKALTS